MARKIDLSRYGGMQGTKLTADDLEADATVLTITEFGDQRNPEGVTPTLRFKEAPDKLLYINRTQLEYIVKKLGDDPDTWVGKRVPVEKKIVPFEGNNFPKVYVMPPERWDEALRAWDRERQPESSAPAKAGARSGAKR